MAWWKTLRDKMRGGHSRAQRRHARYRYAVRVQLNGPRWGEHLRLTTSDVSEGGLFVPTTRLAEEGEILSLAIFVGPGEPLGLTGRVAHVLTPDRAHKKGRPPGMGIELMALSEGEQAQLRQLVERARTSQPAFESDDVDAAAAAAAPTPADPARPRRASAPGAAVDPGASADDIGMTFRATGSMKAVQAPVDAVPAPAAPAPEHVDTAPATAAAPVVRTRRRPIVGIDLGTTNLSVAARAGSKIRLFRWPNGQPFWPSVVSIPGPGEVLLGQPARELLTRDPRRTIASPKRFLGRSFDDPEIEPALAQAPYDVSAGPDGSIVIGIGGDSYAVTQICSYLLGAARDLAQQELDLEVERCVMTVPVSFSEERLEAYRRAAMLAGLEVVAMIDEPSSAALANRFQRGFDGTVGVYDFGGGTFDFSVVEARGGNMSVLATGGDTWLGGDDFDDALARLLANEIFAEHGVDVTVQAVEMQRLLVAAEKCKRDLSHRDRAELVCELGGTGSPLTFRRVVTRQELESACAELALRATDCCRQVLEYVGIDRSSIERVFLSGGTTRMPIVRRVAEEFFAAPVGSGVPPEEAVCLGAAAHGYQLEYDLDVVLPGREPHPPQPDDR